MADEWRPELYDSKLGFVSAHGQHVIGLLQPKAGESCWMSAAAPAISRPASGRAWLMWPASTYRKR